MASKKPATNNKKPATDKKPVPVHQVEEEVEEVNEEVEEVNEEVEEVEETFELPDLEELIMAAANLTEALGLEPELYEEGMDESTLVERIRGIQELLQPEDSASLDDATKATMASLGVKIPEPKPSKAAKAAKAAKKEKAPKVPKVRSVTRIEVLGTLYKEGKMTADAAVMTQLADDEYVRAGGGKSNLNESKTQVGKILSFLKSAGLV